jgi:hypothetical protein
MKRQYAKVGVVLIFPFGRAVVRTGWIFMMAALLAVSTSAVELDLTPQSVSGNIRQETIQTEVGTLKREYAVYTVSGQGNVMALTAPVEKSDAPLLLEIQEIHNRRPDVFGYTVLVNGTEVYFRTYEEIADGPNHYFVQVPRGLISESRMQITFRNEGDAPFSIGRVWAYANFAALAEADATWRKMPILGNADILLGLVGEKGKQPQYKDFQNQAGTKGDLTPWKEMHSQFESGGVFSPGFNYQIGYPQNTVTDLSIRESLSDLLGQATKADLTAQFVMNGGEWGGHPSGPDGRGGFFYDLRYSQACYNFATKSYRPTWPGTPGNTIWPSRYNPELETFLQARVERTSRLLAEEIGFFKAAGNDLKPVYIMSDAGVALWTQGQNFGDFNPLMVAAAQRDGLTLNPEDGLTKEERIWLHRNLTRFGYGSGRAMARGLGRDFVRVADGRFSLPELQLNDNLFSHPFFDPAYPCYDDRWAGWQNGVNPDQWTGGETLEKLNPDYYDYVAALGKLTCVNLERGATVDYSYIGKLYQRGFQHVNLYSYFSGDLEALLKDTARMEEQPCLPARHHLRKLLDVDFPRDAVFGPEKQIVSSDNLKLSPGFNPQLLVSDASRKGQITFRVENGKQSLPQGVLMSLHFNPQYGVSKNPGYSITVSAGRSPDSLSAVKTLSTAALERTEYWPFYRFATVDLGDTLSGLTEGYIRITLDAGGVKQEPGLRALNVSVPWEKTSGHPGGEPFTVRQMRTMRLWIQDRAVFQRQAERYRALGGSAEIAGQAEVMAAAGRPRAAYRLLAGEYSLLLPASFAVQGKGPLGRYPVALELEQPENTALVELIRADKDGVEAVFTTKEPQRGKLLISGLSPGSRYSLEEKGAGRFIVTPGQSGALLTAEADGSLSVELQLKPVAISGEDGFLAAGTGRIPSRKLTAMFLGNGKYEVQDPELYLFNPLVIPLAQGAKVSRWCGTDPAAKGESGMREGDRVELMLNEAGHAVEIKAFYGEDEGRIKSFQPPAVYPEPCNGIIELENGKRYELMFRYRFTKINMPGLQELARANAIESFAKVFKPGQSVKIIYSPYTWNGNLPRIISVSSGGQESGE